MRCYAHSTVMPHLANHGGLRRRPPDSWPRPAATPVPSVGTQCHELRINDAGHAQRIMYHVEPDAVVVLDVFSKKTEATPTTVLSTCRRRLSAYREAARKKG